MQEIERLLGSMAQAATEGGEAVMSTWDFVTEVLLFNGSMDRNVF